MTVLQVCAYGAEYPGNFIASLEALERSLKEKNITTIYAFVERAKNRKWCIDIAKRTKVYFLPEAKARIKPQTYQIFKNIYKENDIDIVHTHFELYDIPATLTAPKNIKIFWHLHDPIELQHNLRGLLWKIQYGFAGKKATLLAVSDYYRKTVIRLGFHEQQTHTVLNSIQLDRLDADSTSNNKIYDFLTFGWDFYRKGDDIILKACEKLARDGYQFKLLLNGNEKTWTELNTYLNGKMPQYLDCGEPVKNVNELFDASKVFIQASRRETFSYAVCEAAYSGIPVISSDIAGLEWAHEIPTIDFFESENVDQLYQLMKQYLDGKTIDESYIKTAKNIIKKKYGIDVWTNNIISLYNKKVNF